MSLRARLLAVVVSLTAVGLVVASVVTYQQLHSFLVDRVDHQAQGSAEAIVQSFEHGRPGPGVFDAINAAGAANPGLYVGAASRRNRSLESPTQCASRRDAAAAPDLPASRATAAAAAGGGPFTVKAVDGRRRASAFRSSRSVHRISFSSSPRR